uniref:Aminopeptidase n=1 Tax=Strigamia maritima TaxID=126957 RepID=T1IZH7_STRMM
MGKRSRFTITFAILFSVLSTCAAQCSCSDSDWIFESNDTESNITLATELIRRQSEQSILDYRLPTALIPIHYDLELQPYLTFPNFTFDGEVIIWCECRERTDQIIVHSRNLDITYIALVMPNGDQGPNITNVTTDYLRDFLIIDLAEGLEVGDVYGIQISFNGLHSKYPFKDFIVAFYHMDNETRFLAITQFEPISARTAFPCFDEPQLKATFNITVVRLQNMTSLSNMPLSESEPRDDVWIADYFEKSPKMSTYIVAIAVSDFDFVEKQVGNTTIRIWVRPNAINQTKLALETVGPLLNYMEEYLDIPYSLPKLDIIGIPNVNYGAMENWGLITFDEKNLLYLNNTPNRAQKYFTVSSFLAHEIAHQVQVNLNFTIRFVFFELSQMETDFRSHRVSLGSLTQNEIRSKIFTRITYVKGAILIRMMEKLGGVKVLKNGLKNYLRSNTYGNVNRNDLWYFISQALKDAQIEDINVKEIMDTWVLQQGLPIVTVTRNYVDNTAFVRQRVFQDKRSRVNFNSTSKWAIPLMFSTKAMNSFDVKPQKWMHEEDYVQFTSADGIPSPHEWVLFNPSIHGYYVVNYDNRNWKLLLNQLITDHTKLPPLVRVYLVQTLHLLKRNDLIPHHLAYSVLEYIRNERNEQILSVGLQATMDLLRIFKPTPHYPLFRKYLLYVILPIWKHVQSTPKPESGLSYFQQLIYKLACIAGVKECIEEVGNKVFSPTGESIDEERCLDDITVCALMRDIRAEKWEELWSLRNNLTRNYTSFLILKSYSCTENPYLLYNRQLALRIFKENLMEISKWSNAEYIIHALSNTAITQQDVDEITAIISCIPQKYIMGKEADYRNYITTAQEEIETRRNTISVNYKWLKRAADNLPSNYEDEYDAQL